MRRAEAEAVPIKANPSQDLLSSPNPSTTTPQSEQFLSLSRPSSLLVQMRGLRGERVGELCSPSQPWNSELCQPWSKHFPRLPATSQNCPWSGRDATPPSSPRHVLYYSSESLGCFKYHKTKTTAALAHHRSLPRPQGRAPPGRHQGRGGEPSPHSPFQESVGSCLGWTSLVVEAVRARRRESPRGCSGTQRPSDGMRLEVRVLDPPRLSRCQAWGFRNCGLSPLGESEKSSQRSPQKGGSSPPRAWEASSEQKSKHSSERKEPCGHGGVFLPQGSAKPKDKSSGEAGRAYKFRS